MIWDASARGQLRRPADWLSPQANKPGQATWGPVRRAAVLVLKARCQAATGDLTAAGATLAEASAAAPSSSSRSGPQAAAASPSSSAAADGDLSAALAPFAAHLNCSAPFSLTVDVAALAAAIKAADAAKGKGNDAFKTAKLPEARKAYGAENVQSVWKALCFVRPVDRAIT